MSEPTRWRKIEDDPPPLGETVLVTNSALLQTARWTFLGWFAGGTSESPLYFEPTHWQPIDPQPEMEDDGNE